MKIRPGSAELFHTDGRTDRKVDGQTHAHRQTHIQTDMRQLLVASLNLAKTLEI